MPPFMKKLALQNAANVLVSLTLPGPNRGAYNPDTICILEKKVMLHGRLVQR